MPISTAVVGDACLAAVLARFDMAAECSRAAGLDGRHHLSWSRLMCPACTVRQAALWARKMSATSSA